MRVRFLTSISTPTQTFSPDSVHELGDLLSSQWIKAGWCIKEDADAQPAAEPPVVATEPVVTAEPKPRRARKGKTDDLL